MYIRQISIFLENVRGTLRELTELLGSAGIDLMALSVADTEQFGIIRCVVKGGQIDEALKILRGAGYTTHMTDMICVCVPDRPAGLAQVLRIVDEADISVEYLYSVFRSAGSSALIAFRLSDPEKGLRVLRENGIELFDQSMLDAL